MAGGLVAVRGVVELPEKVASGVEDDAAADDAAVERHLDVNGALAAAAARLRRLGRGLGRGLGGGGRRARRPGSERGHARTGKMLSHASFTNPVSTTVMLPWCTEASSAAAEDVLDEGLKVVHRIVVPAKLHNF